MNNVTDAEQAARLALKAANKARIQGTFGVGAALVEDRTGSVLDVASNDVVRPVGGSTTGHGSRERRSEHFTHDPTAHGERQLISRYFERIGDGEALPTPGDLTIVSSLEPCAMCAGAILAGGFKVGVIALDSVAGLGAMGNESFLLLPEFIRDRAAESFGYYEIPGVRPFGGSPEIAFGESEQTRIVNQEVHDACEVTFQESLDKTMAVVSEGGQEAPVMDPADLAPNNPLRTALEGRLPHFLSLRLTNPRKPDRDLVDLLITLGREDPGRGSSAALVDQFGNLLTASGGGPVDDPTATGFAELIRTYSRVRFGLNSDPELAEQARECLIHPKFGILFRYPLPEVDSPSTLFELGAYGSTMEGPLPPDNRPNLQYLTVDTEEEDARDRLLGLVRGMPPFYSDIVGLDLRVESLRSG